MKIAIVGSVGIPANYGGFETLVENLTNNKSESIEYVVFCSSKSYGEKLEKYNNSRLIYLPFKANGWQSIIYDTVSIIYSFFLNVDIVLMLGNSSPIFLITRCFSKTKYINNVAGIECLRNKFSYITRLYVKMMMYINSRWNHYLVGDNTAVCDYYTENYGVDNIKLIEYGGDNAYYVSLSEDIKLKYELPEKYFFKVCRIEPENNIHIVLEAFSRLNSHNLVIIGNWSKSEYAINLKKRYSECLNIMLLDPIYDQDILNQIRSNCYAYIHGHSVGGTNPSLVEAMSLKLPVICFDVIFNKETTEYNAIYFSSEKELCEIICSLDDDILDFNAKNMYEIACRRYKWSIIVGKYEELYNDLLKCK